MKYMSKPLPRPLTKAPIETALKRSLKKSPRMKKTPFNRSDVEISRDDLVYDGFFKMRALSLRHRLFAGGWSHEISRELFVRNPAVGVVLYDRERDLVGLVEQFRIGALQEKNGPWCLEIVAGIIDDNESAEDVARREIQEETGLKVDKLDYICNYLSSPGGSNERLDLFCAYCDLSDAGGTVHGLAAEGEDIRFHVLPAADVFAELYQGRFNNAATMISLQWLQYQRLQWISKRAV